MFVDRLNKGQQEILLDLAKQLINADLKILPSEEAFLEALRSQMETDVKPASVPLDRIGTAFSTRSAQISVMLELLGIGLADGELHPAEYEFCEGIAESIGLGRNRLPQLVDWCRKQLSLMSEIEAILAGE